MTLAQRIKAFIRLREALQSLAADERETLITRASQENGWFTEPSVTLALEGIQVLLEPSRLESWAKSYPCDHDTRKTVGVAMAGNIPLVGFHDLLCVLMSGHALKYKPSSKDTVLLDFVKKKLVEIEPGFGPLIEATDRLNGVDAVIATGSDNTARYFEYYFRNIPHILRKNRVSCAVIQGDEPGEEMARLGTDIFSYYGLGCRNVSTLFVPPEFDLSGFYKQLDAFSMVLDNHKYVNNYTYQKSLLMLNQESFLDNGFLLLRESESLISPVAMLHYTVYRDQADLKQKIDIQRGSLQVIVSAGGWYAGSIPFGTAQFPRVDDYADGVDTMKFLAALR